MKWGDVREKSKGWLRVHPRSCTGAYVFTYPPSSPLYWSARCPGQKPSLDSPHAAQGRSHGPELCVESDGWHECVSAVSCTNKQEGRDKLLDITWGKYKSEARRASPSSPLASPPWMRTQETSRTFSASMRGHEKCWLSMTSLFKDAAADGTNFLYLLKHKGRNLSFQSVTVGTI